MLLDGKLGLGPELIRFAFVGGANTALTYGVLVILALAIDASVAYTVAFVAGIMLGALLTGRLVFATRPSTPRRAAYIAWLLVVYGVGLLVVRLVDSWNGVPTWLVAASPLMITAPLNFVGGRVLLRDRIPVRGV